MSSCTNSTRSAEQRWPALSNADLDGVGHHLFDQRGTIDNHGVLATGFGDQGRNRSVARGERAGDRPRDLGRASEHHTGDACVGDQSGADSLALSGQQGQNRRWDAGAMEQADHTRRDHGRLFGGLRDDRVPGGQSSGNLAGEDR